MTFPFFKQYRNYLISITIFGLVYDIVYTNTLFLHATIFLLVGLIIKKYYSYFNYNLFNGIIINTILIIVYRYLTYFVLALIGYISFNFNLVLNHIHSFILINTLYFMVAYFLIVFFCRKLTLK